MAGFSGNWKATVRRGAADDPVIVGGLNPRNSRGMGMLIRVPIESEDQPSVAKASFGIAADRSAVCYMQSAGYDRLNRGAGTARVWESTKCFSSEYC